VATRADGRSASSRAVVRADPDARAGQPARRGRRRRPVARHRGHRRGRLHPPAPADEAAPTFACGQFGRTLPDGGGSRRTRGTPVRSGLVRKAAKTAGIALIAGTVGGAALLAAEAMAARSRRYAKPDLGLAVRATLGRDDQTPLRLVLLGDAI